MAEEVELKRAEMKAWAVATRLKAHTTEGDKDENRMSKLTGKFAGGSYSVNTAAETSSHYSKQKAEKQAKKGKAKKVQRVNTKDETKDKPKNPAEQSPGNFEAESTTPPSTGSAPANPNKFDTE